MLFWLLRSFVLLWVNGSSLDLLIFDEDSERHSSSLLYAHDVKYLKEATAGAGEQPLASISALNSCCLGVENYAENKLNDVPNYTESIEANITIGLRNEQFFLFLLVFTPLDEVVIAMKHESYDEHDDWDDIIQDKVERIEIFRSATSSQCCEYNESPPNQVKDIAADENLRASLEVLSISVSDENMKDAEGQVVGDTL